MRTFFYLTIAAVSLVFAGCSGGDNKPQETVIRFWHFWSEPNQRDAIQKLVQEFEQSHNVRVELTELSWSDGKTKLLAAFNSGSPPDVIELGSDWVAQFSSAGVLLSLPLDSATLHRFDNRILGTGMWDGRLYTLPWTIDTRVLYVNMNLLEKAGWKGAISTLSDLQQCAEALQDAGLVGFGTNGADAHRLYKKILPVMWTFGGEVLDSTGKPTINSPQNIQAFEYYAAMARTGKIETQRQLDAAFLQGTVGLWMSGSWLIDRIQATPSINVQALPMPGVNGKPGISFAGGEYLAVSASTGNTQRSRELVQFLTSADKALALCTSINEAGFPADKATMHNDALINKPMKKVFADQLLHARMTPVHPRWLDIEEALENALVRVLLGEATAQQALTEAQDEVVRFTQSR
ncbi:MAG: extracellular solute-binding protein [Chlorobi bacterium]|nr:MAG: extracellular solute-binding protein [Bacteroidota bacterium]KXK35271.1 MAG: ABC-type sugar transport system periplasmic subunit [Chlorobi bacterium OLB6]MBE2264922.1 extracellular solute-binding protein [Flavobacteriales bacterium]MBL1160581.1 extracellular solute-binding protein [Chlorobiota bacterium]MBW7853171.1 extracellular solute-binding protein [Candidatus Kapabacteria bacterium]MCC6331340.1 extracellular solute-binding protein [Ignavibacteria bacterium]